MIKHYFFDGIFWVTVWKEIKDSKVRYWKTVALTNYAISEDKYIRLLKKCS